MVSSRQPGILVVVVVLVRMDVVSLKTVVVDEDDIKLLVVEVTGRLVVLVCTGLAVVDDEVFSEYSISR